MRSTSRTCLSNGSRSGKESGWLAPKEIAPSQMRRSRLTEHWESPLPVIVELLSSYLQQTGRWRHEGQSLRLVNKAWSDSIDSLTRALNLKLAPDIEFTELAKSMKKFPLVQELLLDSHTPDYRCYGNKLYTVSSFEHLKILEIRNLTLKGKALRILCLKTTLHKLTFSSTKFDHKSLMRLGRLSNLKYLSLQSIGECHPQEDFRFLNSLHQLEHFMIQDNAFVKNRRMMENVGLTKSLKYINLDRPDAIQDAEVKYLSSLTSLVWLRLFCKEIKNTESLGFLASFPHLQHLELFEVESRLLEGWIDKVVHLHTLALSCARLGESFNLPSNIEALIPNLTHLTLYDFTVPSPQLEALIKLGANLCSLSLGSLTLESKISLSSLQNLTSFACNYNRHLESEYLLEMTQLKTLRELTVGHLKGNVVNHLFELVAKHLDHLTSLSVLDLMFNDDRIGLLSQGLSLERITIIQCPTFGEVLMTSLSSMSGLKNLKWLDVACELSVSFWEQFLNLEFLTKLDCLGLKVTNAQSTSFVSNFKEKAPTVKVLMSERWANSLFNNTMEVFKR